MQVLVIPAGAKPDDPSDIVRQPSEVDGESAKGDARALTWGEVAALNGAAHVEPLDGDWATARAVDGLGLRDVAEPTVADVEASQAAEADARAAAVNVPSEAAEVSALSSKVDALTAQITRLLEKLGA